MNLSQVGHSEVAIPVDVLEINSDRLRKFLGGCHNVALKRCMRAQTAHFLRAWSRENKMKRCGILRASAKLACGLTLFGVIGGSTAEAAEIKLLCAVALHPAIDVLIPVFERSSGHKVAIAYGNAGAIAKRFEKGEGADLMINAEPFMDQLRAQGKIVDGDRTNVAKVGVSAFVRKGAAKPDMSSPEAFKRSMLAAQSIIYPDPAGGGASGVYMAKLLERIGIAAEMKPKTTLSPDAKVLYASVASGEIEIGFNQISEVLAQPGVEFAGPLPSAIQNYTQFVPGIVTGSNQADGAKALLSFLYSPAAKAVLKAKGFE